MFQKVSVIGLSIMCGLLGLGLWGCVIDGSESGVNATVESQTEQYIDLDNNQKGALGLIFGMPQIDDRLDYDGGDREDWRYIIVSEPGTMSITINVDNPAKIDGGWNIYDSELRALHSQSFSKGQGYYEFKNFPVKRGTYFFKTYATAGKSIYTIATAFQPTPAAPVVVAEPDPIVEDEPEPEPTKPVSTGRTGGGKKPKPAPVVEDDPKPSKPKHEEPKDTGGSTFYGSITGITPKPDGSTEITISGGKKAGIETGMVGTIEGLNVKIEMINCFNTSCRSLVPSSVEPNKLKGGKKVKFTVK